MSNSFGKNALVTGASRGIGRASALALAKAGAQVLVHYSTSEKEADAIVGEIRQGRRPRREGRRRPAAGGWSRTFWPSGYRAIVGDRLDILVGQRRHRQGGEHRGHADRGLPTTSFAVNVRAPFFLVQQLLPALCKGSNIILRLRSPPMLRCRSAVPPTARPKARSTRW